MQPGRRQADRADGSPVQGRPRPARAKQHHVLVVDDDEDDVDLLREVFQDVTVPVDVHVARDGSECLDALPRMRPRPELILLELETRQSDGMRTLARLKEDERFRHIPVLIFTDVDDPFHIHDCYDRHAAAYVTKPVDLDEYRALVQAMHVFWFDCAALCDD